MPDFSEHLALFTVQDEVLLQLQAIADPQLNRAKLCGGTALARCWLGHRVSYDLDFFFKQGFSAGKLAVNLKTQGIEFEAQEIVDDPYRANQLHGAVTHAGQRLKVSFIEDAYFDLFPVVRKPFGSTTVRTESAQGLYHRKLRTVCGQGTQGDSFEGGRQTARDLFDLYVLSQAVMPLRPFMQSLPYAFPAAAFDNGLANMPWFDLMDELAELVCAEKWAQAKDVTFLQNALYGQIGASIVGDF